MPTPVWYGVDSQFNKNSEAVVPISRVNPSRDLLAQLGLLLNLLSPRSSLNHRNKRSLTLALIFRQGVALPPRWNPWQR